MGLYRRKDSKKWWMCFTVNSKRFRRSTETTDRRLAEKIYAKVLTQITEGKWFDLDESKQHTFEELMDRYLKEHSVINKTKESYENDKNYIKHLSKVFAGLTLDRITPKLIAEYKTLRSIEGAKPQTIKHEMICLNHALNLALKEWEWINFNPCQRVKMPKVVNQIDRWLTFEEQESLLTACYDREWLKDIILFALNTGMRQREIMNLKWTDIDMLRKTATLQYTKNKEKRTVPLNHTIIELLKAKRKVVSMNGYVFTQNGEQLTKRTIQRQFSTAVNRAKITNFRFHDLRHTFATRLAQSGVDIYTIAKLLGHKDIRMTQRYAHHCPESIRFDVNILDNLNMQNHSREKENIVLLSHFYHGKEL
ncbi:MAG: tyrosine-type recombinase/integrase [Thermodesulfovibrionales bacterium]